MPQVEITRTPPGQAPEWVRNEWIGLILPVDMNAEGSLQIGARGGKPENMGGYTVPTKAALEILAQKNSEAAEWWRDHLPVMPSWLVFSKEVCTFIED